MAQAKLLDLKEKLPKPNPLVEIIGPIDIGKTPIAHLVARRVKGTFIPFPVLDPTTLTGRGLLSSLATGAKALEQNPHWWAHIYAANMYEQVSRIKNALTHGPVIVTNYTMAYRLWMRALGVDTTAFTSNLPVPNLAYILCGEQIAPTDRPIFDFSYEFVQRIRRGMFTNTSPFARKIVLSDFESKWTHTYVNNICTAISSNLRTKYSCKVNEKELYTTESFMQKKEL
jgi:hypothetical protein